MKVSPEEIRRVVEEIGAAVPELAGPGLKELLGAVASATMEGFSEIERSAWARGSLGREEAGTFIGMGATAEICVGFPEGDVRRRLFEAGKILGRLIAEKWAAKISEVLASKAGVQ
jgi:hypothetical protein